MSCTCHSTPCSCQGTSGTVWSTPSPGSVIVAPVGTKIVQTPQKFPCNPEQVQATAIPQTPSQTQQIAPSAFYPKLLSDITVPNIGNQGQFRSLNASEWAIPGMAVWIPPFGTVKVLGFSSDIVTYENINIPSGTSIAEATILVPSGEYIPNDNPLFNYSSGSQLLFQVSDEFAKTVYPLLGVPSNARFALVAIELSATSSTGGAYAFLDLYSYYGPTQAIETIIGKASLEAAINGAYASVAVIPIVNESLAFRLAILKNLSSTRVAKATVVGYM